MIMLIQWVDTSWWGITERPAKWYRHCTVAKCWCATLLLGAYSLLSSSQRTHDLYLLYRAIPRQQSPGPVRLNICATPPKKLQPPFIIHNYDNDPVKKFPVECPGWMWVGRAIGRPTLICWQSCSLVGFKTWWLFKRLGIPPETAATQDG